ncbi:hypothetical protein Scep_028890 [Stephania cephalantha]|uniref:F-box domain-containing protein n=1 Tax=Stephania cephalantha TaxID=152367 RepID=A0AAP0EF05_9MAGN
MERLPLEIVLDIITRLPIASLLRFKCVCKAWLSIAEDIHLLHLYHQNTAQNNVCLVLQGEHSLDCQLHVIDPSNHHHKTITKRLDPPFKSSMPNFDIAGSCNGFLCLFDDSQLVPDTIFIYNPFTNESKQLPPTNKNFSNQRVVLGFGFLCRLQTGEFMLEYGNQALVPYDPRQEEFKKLDIHGLPNCFETVTFKGSLLPLQDHTQMQI